MTAPDKPGLSNEEHDLKCWDPHFTNMKNGLKDYEIRLNDRNYKIGDVLILRQYDPKAKTYSGDVIRRKVIQMVTDFAGLAPGYVAMGVSAEGKPTPGQIGGEEALLTSKPEPVAGKCPKCKGRIDGLRVCVECGFVLAPEPITADGPYTYSKHQRYEGPGLDEKPDSLGVRELNIAFSEGKKVNEKWLKEYQFQLNAAHGQAPVAPVRKWELDDSVVNENWTYEMTCPECDYRWDEDCVLAVRDCLPEVQDALNRRKA